MATVNINLTTLSSGWTRACRAAVDGLNRVFKQHGVGITLVVAGPTAQGPMIKVAVDPNIGAGLVHGKTHATTTPSGQLIDASIGLPKDVVISTPAAVRPAGQGILEVIAAHELVHALGHEPHNTHLMAQTFQKSAGNTPGGDKLAAGRVALPPLQLSPQSVTLLKQIWP